jgi:hypothetical protein
MSRRTVLPGPEVELWVRREEHNTRYTLALGHSSHFDILPNTMLYTASPLTGKAVQSPIFQKKGIDGLTAGKLAQIHHVGFAVEKQVAYDGYVANLPAFLHATAVQHKVTTSAAYYPTPLSNDNTLPIPLPPLCVSTTLYLRKPCMPDSCMCPIRRVLRTLTGVMP